MVRIIVSLVMFLLVLLVFLDFRNLSSSGFTSLALYFQFIPSLLKFLTIAGWAASGFIVILVFTFLFGRVYCSFLCPLGVFQDIISRVANRFRSKKTRRKGHKYCKPLAPLHYAIFILIVAAFFAGYIAPTGWLDPYSIFGRLMTHMVRPVVIFLNNKTVDLTQSLNLYSLKPLDFKLFSLVSFGIAGGMTLLVMVLAIFRGREYCNTVCPVGAILRITARFSWFRLVIKQDSCNSCGLCARACKAGCIDPKAHTLDFSRCVACYNCIGSCKSGGVVYENAFLRKKEAHFDPDRRTFLAGAATTLLVGGSTLRLLAQEEQKGQNTTRPEDKEFAVCPPGSLSIDHFTSRCTACHLCVSVCPKQVLQPSLLHYGLKGFLQPRMDYHTSYCNFDCVVCSEVCPTGAIQPLRVEEKHLTQIGKAWFIRRNCIVRTDKTDCGACSEHCPTKAVQMVPWRRGLLIPEVNQDICIGCGACEFACPTKPYKAIYVDGNPVHKKADPPLIEEESAPKVSPTDDFPF